MKKIILITIIFMCALITKGQPATQPPQVIPSSPQSQVFEKYINHRITEYNGLPDINIPLYEIKVKGLTIPITLSYHAGGIRFKQYDGEVGAGWNIGACGYRVSRTVNNKPDEATNFYNRNEFEAMEHNGESTLIDKLLSGICDMATESQVNHHPYAPYPGVGWDQDGEYDLFNYSAPTTASRFIISNRANKAALQIKKLGTNLDKVEIINTNNIRIENNIITDILVTDDQGVIYNYGGYDIQNNSLTEKPDPGQDDNRYGRVNTAWMLRQIQTPYNAGVKFDYETFGTNIDPGMPYQLVIQDAIHEIDHYPGTEHPEHNAAGVFTPRKVQTQNMFFVTNIETDNERVQFIRYGKNYPKFEYRHLIKEIVVTSKLDNRPLKKIIFHYEDYCYHQLLSSIDICYPDTEISVEKYQFDYFKQVSESDYKYMLPDQWGYYKYIPGSSPTNIIHEEFKNDNYIDRIQASTTRVEKLYRGFIGYFSNRSENKETHNFLSLKQITFPTKGITSYEYEPNQYYDSYKGKVIQGAGQRIRKIVSRPDLDNTPVVTEFKYGINEDNLGIPNFPFDYQAFADETYICSKYAAYRVDGGSGFYITIMDYAVYTRRTYSENPLGDAGQQIFTVTYPQVAIYQYDTGKQSYNGKTVSYYSNNEIYSTDRGCTYYPFIEFTAQDLYSNYRGPQNIIRYNYSQEPKLQKRIVYNSNGIRLQQEEYKYQTLNTESFEGIKARQKVFLSGYSDPNRSYYLCESARLAEIMGSFYQYHHYVYVNETVLPEEKITTTYNSTGTDPVTVKEIYSYNDRNQLIEKKMIGVTSGRDDIIEEYTYPLSNTELARRNMLSTIIEKQTVESNNGSIIFREYYNYPNNAIFPDHISGLNSRIELTFDRYDSYGNLRQLTTKDMVSTIYLWGYKGQYPIAEIKYATFAQVIAHVNEATLNSIAAKAEPSAADWTLINNLRSNLPNSQVCTYAYKPLVGIKTVTDPSGNTTTYEYDTFNRLEFIKDRDLRKVQENKYNYKNQ